MPLAGTVTIREDELSFTEGSSDKVYKLLLRKIEAAPVAGYTVEFMYGRRGQALRGGQKTLRPTTLAIAERVYNQYLTEKLNKGYKRTNAFVDKREAPALEAARVLRCGYVTVTEVPAVEKKAGEAFFGADRKLRRRGNTIISSPAPAKEPELPKRARRKFYD